MAARLKVDENLPREIALLMQAHGHDAVTVIDQGWRGLPDGELWERIQTERRWLVTADKEFANLRLYPPGTHVGVILLRSAAEGLGDYLELAEMALAGVELDDIPGAVVVLTRRGVRIRRAPGR